MDLHRKVKLYIISLDFYIRITDRMKENLEQEREQLLCLILLMQILCNFYMFVWLNQNLGALLLF